MLETNREVGGFARTSDSDASLVSVIIPSKNSERTIRECLRSIVSQSYNPIEIIVVDCFSTDSTREIAKQMGAVVISHRSERSEAKNLGARTAKGKYLYFVDSDHTLGLDVIATCVKLVEKADAVLVNDQDLPRNSKTSRLIAARRKVLSNDPLNVAARFVTRATFDRVGGFDPGLYAGEDLDLHRRFVLNDVRIAHSQATEWHLSSPVNLKGLLARSMYYSSNYLRYASKNPLISLKRVSPIREVTAWKKGDSRGSDLLPIIILGFLSNTFLVISILLNRGRRKTLGRRPTQP